MDTMTKVVTPEGAADERVETVAKRNRGLWGLVGALFAAVVVLGGMLVFDDDGGPDLTAEQDQMLETIEGYLNAWNDGDGAAATAYMAPSAYHDNGSNRYTVADGELEAFLESISVGFSVRSSVTDGEAAFVGDYVMTTDFIPATSTLERPSIFKMSADGSTILWHYAP